MIKCVRQVLFKTAYTIQLPTRFTYYYGNTRNLKQVNKMSEKARKTLTLYTSFALAFASIRGSKNKQLVHVSY